LNRPGPSGHQGDRIKDQDDVEALRDFVKKFPSSPLAILARNRLDLLERYAKEREELAARAREEERRKAAEAEAQRIARETAARREAEERRRAEQLAAQQRLEDERKREETVRLQAAEQRRLEDEQKRQEAARQEALRQQQLAEQKRVEDEKKRLAVQQQQDEQKRQEAARQEAARQEALRQQQLAEQKRAEDQQKRLAAVQLQAEQKRLEDEAKQRAELARQEETCRREEAKLAQIEASGSGLREQLVKFEIEAACPTLRPKITAAIASLSTAPPSATPANPSIEMPPSPPPANSLDQIRRAQIELRRVGCFAGRSDGRLTEATRDAVKTYWTRTGHALVEVSITDEFIADVHQHDDPVCKAVRIRPEAPPVASHPPAAKPVAREREPAPRRPPREGQRQAPAPGSDREGDRIRARRLASARHRLLIRADYLSSDPYRFLHVRLGRRGATH
jgi:hypothetical protein